MGLNDNVREWHDVVDGWVGTWGIKGGSFACERVWFVCSSGQS